MTPHEPATPARGGRRVSGAMRLLALRTVAATWPRLLATVLAGGLAVGLIAGSVQIGLQAQAAVRGLDTSEYDRVDLVVQTGAPGAAEQLDVGGGANTPGSPLTPDQVTRVARTPGVAVVAGDAAVFADLVGADGKVVTLPLAGTVTVRPWIHEQQLRGSTLTGGHAPGSPGEVVLDQGLAELAGLEVGDTTTLLVPQRSLRVTVAGMASTGGTDSTFAGGKAFMSPEVVSELAGLGGAWPTLRVAADPGTDPAALARDLQHSLGGVTVTPGADLAAQRREMVSSLGANLAGGMAALSTWGVFVGLFVVAAAFSTLVGQRIPQLALLRTIGATPRQVRSLVRLEALAVGLAASALGLLAGFPVAVLMSWALADAGLALGAVRPQLTISYLLVPVAVGVLVMQLAAIPAARRAARVAPVAALGAVTIDRSTRSIPRVLLGVALLILAVLLAGAALNAGEASGSTGMLVLAAGMTLVVALTVLGPYLTVPLGWLVGGLGVAVQGQVGRLARATVVRNPRRVAMAASTLMLAVTLTTMGVLGLRGVNEDVRGGLGDALRATHGVIALGQTGMPTDVADQARTVQGVAVVAPLADQFAQLAGEDAEFMRITGTDPRVLTRLLDFQSGSQVVAGLHDGEVALAEAAARARGLHRGDVLKLRGVQGVVALTVAGTYRTAGEELVPTSVVTLRTLYAVDPSSFVEMVLVGAAPSAGADAVLEGLEESLAAVPTAAVHDRDGLVDAVAGRLISGEPLILGFLGSAVLIAVLGMVITISLSVTERSREFGLLRAVGATGAQLRAVVRWEAATVVLLGTFLGVGCGTATIHLAHLLTDDPMFSAAVPPTWIAATLTAAAAVTLLGSALSARRAASVPVLTATSTT